MGDVTNGALMALAATAAGDKRTRDIVSFRQQIPDAPSGDTAALMRWLLCAQAAVASSAIAPAADVWR